MPEIHFLHLFQGIATMVASDPLIAVARIVLIALGISFVYLGAKGTLEPLIMIPMGIGMASVNAGVLYLSATTMGTIFIDPIASGPEKLVNVLQIDFLQPIYTFMFSNGLIACLVFMGIGAISDIGYMLIAPVRCMIIAIMAELGTVLTFPLAVGLGLNYKEAAAIAMVGSADAPMVLYASLLLARDLFVPITIVAYLYLSLTYAGYPYLIRLLIPKQLRGIKMDQKTIPKVSPAEKMTFSIITGTVLCLLFPVAAPLFMSFFVGVIMREAGVKQYVDFLGGTVLLRLHLLPRPDARRAVRGQHHPQPQGHPAAVPGHDGAAALRHRRHHRRLYRLLDQRPHLQSGDRHCRRVLRADDRQGGAEGGARRQQVRHDPALGDGRLRVRRHLLGHHRRHLRHLAAGADTMMERKAQWIGGTLTALVGVVLVRLLAPALAGFAGSLAVAVGYLLVIVGLTIVARAAKPRGSEDFVTIEQEAKD